MLHAINAIKHGHVQGMSDLKDMDGTEEEVSRITCYLPIMTKSQQIIFYCIISGGRKSAIKINGCHRIHLSWLRTTKDTDSGHWMGGGHCGGAAFDCYRYCPVVYIDFYDPYSVTIEWS